MTTPLIILGLLTAPYVALCAWASVRGKPVNRAVGAVMGLSAVFMFTGVGHFVRTGPMAEMLPPWIPYRVVLIYLTGLLEFALALALLLPRLRRLAGRACIAVLVLFFPVNVYAAINQVGMGGHLWGPVYLLIRGPLQVILIIWAYGLVVRRQGPTHSEGG